MFEDLLPSSNGSRQAAVSDLTREDLDLYGVEALRERIDALERELERTRAALDSKQARKSAADALFSFKDS